MYSLVPKGELIVGFKVTPDVVCTCVSILLCLEKERLRNDFPFYAAVVTL